MRFNRSVSLAAAVFVLAVAITRDAAAQLRRPGGAGDAFAIKEFQAGNGQTLRYSLFVPADLKPEEKLPVVLCLHGRGGNTAAADVLARPESQSKHRAILIAPGIDPARERWVAIPGRQGQRPVAAELMETLDSVVRDHHADDLRVYVTGQSMGGVGTWGLVAAYPERFAAAAPVCGFWPPEEAAKMKSTPIWAFHGAEDATVPVSGSQQMIEALRAAGGQPRYTEYPGLGHNSWSKAYATADLWDWMFDQKRAK